MILLLFFLSPNILVGTFRSLSWVNRDGEALVMDLKALKSMTGTCSTAITMSLFLAACNANFSDPFARHPIGQKFFVPPNSDKDSSMSLNAETLRQRATLLKINYIGPPENTGKAVSSLGSEAPLDFKFISFVGWDSKMEVYDLERIKKLNDSRECQEIARDVEDLILSYPDLRLICGEDFADRFQSALSLTVTTVDGKEHHFTSWGSHLSDGPGYQLMIRSLNLPR
jgi:hypothetical protein